MREPVQDIITQLGFISREYIVGDVVHHAFNGVGGYPGPVPFVFQIVTGVLKHPDRFLVIATGPSAFVLAVPDVNFRIILDNCTAGGVVYLHTILFMSNDYTGNNVCWDVLVSVSLVLDGLGTQGELEIVRILYAAVDIILQRSYLVFRRELYYDVYVTVVPDIGGIGIRSLEIYA